MLEKYLSAIDLELVGTTGIQESRFKTLKKLLAKHWSLKKFTILFHIMLAINLDTFDLNFPNIISLLVSTTSKIFYQMEREWTY